MKGTHENVCVGVLIHTNLSSHPKRHTYCYGGYPTSGNNPIGSPFVVLLLGVLDGSSNGEIPEKRQDHMNAIEEGLLKRQIECNLPFCVFITK